MRKNIIMLLLVGLAPLLAEKLNLSDVNLVERFGASILKEKIDLYDPDEFGLYVLKKDYYRKYQKVRNDEFELDDAKKWAFKKFKEKLERMKPINKSAFYHLFLRVNFKKYDFKNHRFPINALTDRSYMEYYGKNNIVASYSPSKLVFENATDKVNYISMDKSDAKKFIEARKNNYGNIDRGLIAHYIYTIDNFEEVNEFQPNGNKMTLKWVGKLKSVEFMDKKMKHVLKKVDFEKSDNNSKNDHNVTSINIRIKK